jgi:hypothetical protein
MTMPDSFSRAPLKVLMWRALEAGTRLSKHSAAALFQCHLSTADRILVEMHKLELVHVVGWTRNGDRGGMTKVVAFGPGEDLPHPENLSNAFACKRWRNRHEDRARKSWANTRIKRLAREGKLPVGNDPLLMAIMGRAV